MKWDLVIVVVYAHPGFRGRRMVYFNSSVRACHCASFRRADSCDGDVDVVASVTVRRMPFFTFGRSRSDLYILGGIVDLTAVRIMGTNWCCWLVQRGQLQETPGCMSKRGSDTA